MKTPKKASKSYFSFLPLVILSLTLIVHSQSFGQLISRDANDYPPGTNFSSCPGSSCEISLPTGRINFTNTYTIPLLVADPDDVTISNISGGCGVVTVENDLNVVSVTVTKRCISSGSNEVKFRLNVDKGVDSDSQNFIVPMARDTAKIVLVLDVSGSMSLGVPGTTVKRIDLLKQAVQGLVVKFEELRQDGDSLAMTYFSSIVVQPNPPIAENFVLVYTSNEEDYEDWSSEKVMVDLNPRTPGGMTALGEGLINAKGKLDRDTSHDLKRMVFLFTDGLQNWGNKLKPDGLTFYLSTDSLNNYSDNPKDSIYYFPVATWAAGDQPELLQSIVNANKGEVLFATPDTVLEKWFNNQLANMLEGGSPQIVMEKSVPFASGVSNYSFKLNNLVNKLLVELKGNEALDLKVYKDGDEVTNLGKEVNKGEFKLRSFQFPINGEETLYSEGEWSIQVMGESSSSYYVSAIADDHFSKFTCNVDKTTFTVGETLNFTTNLSHLGVPLASGKVQAIVIKPGDDLGHLLSIYQSSLTDTIIDIDTGASAKFHDLMANDTAFFNALLPNEQIVDLVEVTGGKYSGSFSSTELAGFYNIIFLIDTEIPGKGKLQRVKTISTVGVFGNVVEEVPEVVEDPPAPNNNDHKQYTVLSIRPKNKFGYYMGPGFQSRIALRVKGKNATQSKPSLVSTAKANTNEKAPVLFEIKDNLDGSYYLYVANILEDEKWDFAIEVREEVLHNYSKAIPFWVYLILLVIIILIYIFRKKGKANIITWLILVLWIFLILLNHLGYLNLF